MSAKTSCAVALLALISAGIAGLTAQTSPAAELVSPSFALRSLSRPIAPAAAAAATLQTDDKFNTGAHGWTAVFADWSSPGTGYDLDSGLRPLPADLLALEQGFLLTGKNRSDDLLMGLTKHLGPADGILPGAAYWVEATVEFATNAPEDSVGIGGSPSQGVHLKIGGSVAPPTPTEIVGAMSSSWRLDVDFGQQSHGGLDGTVIGNVSNGLSGPGAYRYVIVSRSGRHVFPVTASPTGDLWITLLTDSGFEGLTALYYTRARFTLTPVAVDGAALSNVSSRAVVRPNQGDLIAGFVLQGAAKTLLVRGVGPGLVPQGVTNPLPDPHVDVVQTGVGLRVRNENWEDLDGGADLRALSQRLGAFPLAAASRDAALIYAAPPGVYSAVVAGTAAQPRGDALAEIYDADPSDHRGRIVNLSVRAWVGETSPAFGGLVVVGDTPARLLIRVVGPTLASLGVAQPTPKPRLEIHRGASRLATAMNFVLRGARPAAQAIAREVGAFALPENSEDLEFVVVLPPGVYSLVFDGIPEGVALLEVYTAP